MITDEEYVKRIRQYTLRTKSRVVYAMCGVMFGAISLGFLIVILKFVALFPEPENHKSIVWCSLAFGFAFGAISGHYAIMGMRFLLDAILGHRTEKLMLRYHDELAALKGEPNQQTSNENHIR